MFIKARNDGNFPFSPVVIIGAARSGTNALRDVLARLPGFATWPCDEINPIWRHGNLGYPDDAIPPERATEFVQRYIRTAFYRLWRQSGRPVFVVEKTCANSLRVPFVDRVLPEARYIYIVRDGYDVVASAKRRWRGELEMPGLPYFLAKARYAPLSDLPWYALSAVRSRLAVRAGRRDHLTSWGPRFSRMERFAGAALEEIVARQWAACVHESDAAFASMASYRVFPINYELFTADPRGTVARIAEWLGVEIPESVLIQATEAVRARAVSSGRAGLEQVSPNIREILAPSLRAHGYRA